MFYVHPFTHPPHKSYEMILPPLSGRGTSDWVDYLHPLSEGYVMGWIVFPQNSYVEVITPPVPSNGTVLGSSVCRATWPSIRKQRRYAGRESHVWLQTRQMTDKLLVMFAPFLPLGSGRVSISVQCVPFTLPRVSGLPSLQPMAHWLHLSLTYRVPEIF